MLTPHLFRRSIGLIITISLLILAGCGLQPSARVVEPVGPALSSNHAIVPAVAPAVVAAPAPVASFEVRAANLTFTEHAVVVAAPGHYRVRFVNQDEVAHEIVFDDGTRLPAAPGETASAIVDIPAAGAAFLCSNPAHRAAGMVGQVTVTE